MRRLILISFAVLIIPLTMAGTAYALSPEHDDSDTRAIEHEKNPAAVDSAYFEEPRETIVSSDEKEVAQAIIDDLKERKGIEITKDTNLGAVREFLLENGYQNINAEQLMITLFEELPNSGVIVPASSHTHQFMVTVDFETKTVNFDCACGEHYDSYVASKSILESFAKELAEDPTRYPTPKGNEFKKMTAEEYFLDQIVPPLFHEWGENNYYWYYDEELKDIHLMVTVDDIESVADRAIHNEQLARKRWDVLKKRVNELSISLQGILDRAGFLSTVLTVGLMDSKMGQYYIVRNGSPLYDMIADYDKTGEF